MDFEPGKLYVTDARYFLLVYPSPEKVAVVHAAAAGRDLPAGAAEVGRAAQLWAERWSKALGCQVRLVEPDTRFMYVEPVDAPGLRNLAHVLFGDFDGWIITANWLEFRPV